MKGKIAKNTMISMIHMLMKISRVAKVMAQFWTSNPLETVLSGQGNDEALDALNTIENEVNSLGFLGIPAF